MGLPSISNLPTLGIGRRRRRRSPLAILHAIERLFPGYLSGEALNCAVPPFPEWHLAAGAWQGSLLDCAWPTPGADGVGVYDNLDCMTEPPASAAPAGAIHDRAGNPILDRAGNFILVRSAA